MYSERKNLKNISLPLCIAFCWCGDRFVCCCTTLGRYRMCKLTLVWHCGHGIFTTSHSYFINIIIISINRITFFFLQTWHFLMNISCCVLTYCPSTKIYLVSKWTQITFLIKLSRPLLWNTVLFGIKGRLEHEIKSRCRQYERAGISESVRVISEINHSFTVVIR